MKRIRGDSDFLSIPWKGFNSETPFRWPDPVDQVSTLWITLPPSGPTKRVSRVGWALSAVAFFGCQKDSCFCSWTLWITTLTQRVRHRPSGSATNEPEGRRVPLLFRNELQSRHGGRLDLFLRPGNRQSLVTLP